MSTGTAHISSAGNLALKLSIFPTLKSLTGNRQSLARPLPALAPTPLQRRRLNEFPKADIGDGAELREFFARSRERPPEPVILGEITGQAASEMWQIKTTRSDSGMPRLPGELMVTRRVSFGDAPHNYRTFSLRP